MLREGYEVTSAYEANHWWFRSRRRLFLSQVARAAKEIGRPNLRILDYGCGTGFNLSFLAEYGSVVGADVADLALGEFKSEAGSYPRLDLRDDLSQ
jgi:SAM-dependent methyltransferase